MPRSGSRPTPTAVAVVALAAPTRTAADGNDARPAPPPSAASAAALQARVPAGRIESGARSPSARRCWGRRRAVCAAPLRRHPAPRLPSVPDALPGAGPAAPPGAGLQPPTGHRAAEPAARADAGAAGLARRASEARLAQLLEAAVVGWPRAGQARQAAGQRAPAWWPAGTPRHLSSAAARGRGRAHRRMRAARGVRVRRRGSGGWRGAAPPSVRRAAGEGARRGVPPADGALHGVRQAAPGATAGGRPIGPRALALIGVLGTRYHLTQGKTRDLLAQVLGLDFSLGPSRRRTPWWPGRWPRR